MTDVLLCVGNSMMGDDGAGPLLAELCAANPPGNWVVIDGGSAPENDVVAIRELHPDRLLIVDATDMGLNPGEIRLIDPDDIAEMFMMTTHNMPLNYLVDRIKDDVGEVLFLGIQPDIVGFYYPMTPPVKRRWRGCIHGLPGGLEMEVFLRSEQCRVAASPYPAYQTHLPLPVGEGWSEGNRLLEIPPLLAITFLYHPNDFLRFRSSVPFPASSRST